MREIVTAASAAGVAVAFGSPIGGVLFSLEVGRKMCDQNVHSIMICSILYDATGNDDQLSHQDDVAKFLLRSCRDRGAFST